MKAFALQGLSASAVAEAAPHWRSGSDQAKKSSGYFRATP